MKSLQGRLQLGLFTSIVLLVGLLWFFGSRSARGISEQLVISHLQHDAESIVEALVLERGLIRLRWRRTNPVFQQTHSGHYYVVAFADGLSFESPSLADHRMVVTALSPGETERHYLDGPQGQKLLVWVRGMRLADTEFTLAVAEDLSHFELELQQLQRQLGLVLLFGLLGLLATQALLVQRTFRSLSPLQRNIDELATGKAENLSEDVPSEVLPLVRDYNRLLRMLGQRLQRSRNAFGNLTHALKTPLALLNQYLNRHDSADSATLSASRQQVERIQQLIERELTRARLAGTGTPRQRFDPHRELPDLIGVLRQIHAGRALEIDYRLPATSLSFGDREDLVELLGNLLDNACKWARRRVLCVIEDAGSSILIRVEDDGEGVSAAATREILGRGVRLDEETAGHGLGLAIVGDIVTLYGGELSLDPSPELGGLRAQVRLPSNPPIE